jgi:hypothetical protein
VAECPIMHAFGINLPAIRSGLVEGEFSRASAPFRGSSTARLHAISHNFHHVCRSPESSTKSTRYTA